jgi:thiol-disulfide isomerase/thioredoxin
LDLKRDVHRFDSLASVGAAKIQPIIKQFIIDHNDSYVSVQQVQFFKSIWKTDTLSKYFNVISDNMQNSFNGMIVRNYLSKSVKVGAAEKDFSILDVYNNPLRLSDFRGKKFVLLDFWASWCIPCISEFPDLKSFYQKHGSDIEIIGLSVDEDEIAWKRALKKHHLPWRQARIGLAPDNDKLTDKYIGNLYLGVKTIPRQFLIDRNGTIVEIFSSSPLDMERLKSLIK